MDREEAIRRIKAWNLDSDDMEVLSVVVPELAESEDEKIRKELIEFLREAYSRGNTPEECAKWLVWLDWPKEQEHSDSAQFEEGFKTGLELGLRKKKEQKPAEWSEEDEEMIGSIISSLRGYMCLASKSPYYTNHETHIQKEIEFLNDLLLQPKQEWSEEDEKIMQTMIKDGDLKPSEVAWLKSHCTAKDCSSCAKHLEGYISGRSDAENKLLEQFGALVTPEGELHIKPRWKPSEEQMEALSDAYVEASTFKKGDILESLYNDLKKLM